MVSRQSLDDGVSPDEGEEGRDYFLSGGDCWRAARSQVRAGGGDRFASSREGQRNGGQGKREEGGAPQKKKKGGGGSPAPVLGRPEMGNCGGGGRIDRGCQLKGELVSFLFFGSTVVVRKGGIST